MDSSNAIQAFALTNLSITIVTAVGQGIFRYPQNYRFTELQHVKVKKAALRNKYVMNTLEV